ncbi:MAG: FAD-binding protein [Comamonadaceae bacterium]|nr:MAG: FAD-binding protein [Comamonadaceae bacterium]
MPNSDRDATTPHDVLIIGGGLVGASLAIALAGQGLDVAMVEASPAGALPAVFDERNLSFAEATVNALDALGVLPLLRAPTGSIRRIHASRAGDFGRVRLEAAAHRSMSIWRALPRTPACANDRRRDAQRASATPTHRPHHGDARRCIRPRSGHRAGRG